jgi:hypothetical protein
LANAGAGGNRADGDSVAAEVELSQGAGAWPEEEEEAEEEDEQDEEKEEERAVAAARQARIDAACEDAIWGVHKACASFADSLVHAHSELYVGSWLSRRWYLPLLCPGRQGRLPPACA